MTIFIVVLNGWVESAHETFDEAKGALQALRPNAPWKLVVFATNEGLREAGWTAGDDLHGFVVERRVNVKKPSPSDSMFGRNVETSSPMNGLRPWSHLQHALETTDIYNRNPEGAAPPEGWTSPHGLRKVRA